MLGRQSYGRSAPAGGDYAGGRGYSTGPRYPERERWNPQDRPRQGGYERTWARDTMPDRGYSAYGGDYGRGGLQREFDRSRGVEDRPFSRPDPERDRYMGRGYQRGPVGGSSGTPRDRDRGWDRYDEGFGRGRMFAGRETGPEYDSGRDRYDWRDREDWRDRDVRDTRARDQITRRLDPDRYEDDDYPWNMYGRDTYRGVDDDDRWYDPDRHRGPRRR